MYIENKKHNYLVHHGIKNQKWGVRNGPPYPIDHHGQHNIKTDLQFFANNKIKNVKTPKELYKGEFNLVRSDFNYWQTKAQKELPTYTHEHRDHVYTMDNKTGKIIHRRKIKDSNTGLLERDRNGK